ncbi:hypothetical protein ACWEQ7_04215 [Streptomyces sp. NPDC004069]
MDRKATPAPPEPPGSPHGETSHTRSVLGVMVDELERTANRRRLLTEVGLRRAFTAAIGTVPTEVADKVGDRVTALLPDTGPVITHGGYATLLREIAQGARNTPADDENASAAELHDRANADYTDAQSRRGHLSHEDRVHGNETGGR